MTAQELVEVMQRETKENGRREGLQPLAHVCARRLQRPLTDEERDVLLRRLDSLGAERLGDVVLDLAPDALAAWLASSEAA